MFLFPGLFALFYLSSCKVLESQSWMVQEMTMRLGSSTCTPTFVRGDAMLLCQGLARVVLLPGRAAVHWCAKNTRPLELTYWRDYAAPLLVCPLAPAPSSTARPWPWPMTMIMALLATRHQGVQEVCVHMFRCKIYVMVLLQLSNDIALLWGQSCSQRTPCKHACNLFCVPVGSLSWRQDRPQHATKYDRVQSAGSAITVLHSGLGLSRASCCSQRTSHESVHPNPDAIDT